MARAHGRPVDNDGDKLEGIERPFGRLMAYVFHHYPVRISLTVVCIITAAVASAVGSIFMQQIVDNVVTPGLESGFARCAPPWCASSSRWASSSVPALSVASSTPAPWRS